MASSFASADIIENIEDLEPKPKPKRPEPQDDEMPPQPGEANSDEIPAELQELEKKAKAQQAETVKEPQPEPKAQQARPATRSDPKEPVLFKGDGPTVYSRKQGVITLQKNVLITQGQLRMQSDKAKVTFYSEDASKEDVDNVEITGRVKMTKLDPDPKERVVAHGDRAVFYNSEQKVRLIGNARLYRGGDLMKGKQIVYELDTGLVIVDQAQGVVQPSDETP